MDVKTLIVKSSTDHFENRVKEFLEQGYKLQFSNICIQNKQQIIGNNNGITVNDTTFYYYALFIKE